MVGSWNPFKTVPEVNCRPLLTKFASNAANSYFALRPRYGWHLPQISRARWFPARTMTSLRWNMIEPYGKRNITRTSRRSTRSPALPLTRSLYIYQPNPAVNRTAKQRPCARCLVPSALRAPAAGYLKRYAPGNHRGGFLGATRFASSMPRLQVRTPPVAGRAFTRCVTGAACELWRLARGA